LKIIKIDGKKETYFYCLSNHKMKYNIVSNYEAKNGGLVNTTELSSSMIIDNNRQFITTYISPYCSMCGGTGRCGGSCNG